MKFCDKLKLLADNDAQYCELGINDLVEGEDIIQLPDGDTVKVSQTPYCGHPVSLVKKHTGAVMVLRFQKNSLLG